MDPRDRFKLLFEDGMDGVSPAASLNRQRGTGEGVSESGPGHSPPAPQLPLTRHYPLSYIRTYVPGTGVQEGFDQESDDDYLTSLSQDPESPHSPTQPSDDATLNAASNPDLGHSEDSTIILADQGTLSSVTSSFTPALALARFPFRHMSGSLAHRVSKEFYDGGKFWMHAWDLYYLSVPMAINGEALLLIPTDQAISFIAEMSKALNSKIYLTGTGKKGMVLTFDNDNIPLPVFLGRSSSSDKKDQLVQTIPPSGPDWGVWSYNVEAAVMKAFEANIRLSFDMIKKKDPTKVAQQLKRKQEAEEHLGRAMAFFGLRPPWRANTHQSSFANGEIKPIDPTRTVKWTFQDSPIFIAIDVEWNERETRQMTEVGISILDTMDLESVVPGDYGEMWAARIRSRHLRVEEYRQWVNMEFCHGCPDSFDFGESELVPSAHVGRIVDRAFKPPYMVPTVKDPVSWWKMHTRNIVLVGLDMKSDIKQLKTNKSQVFLDYDTPRCIFYDTLDLAELYRAESGELQNRGLANVLRSLQVLHVNMHNAGNDAHYILHGLVRLMIKAAGEKPWAYEEEVEVSTGTKKDTKEDTME
ncbi:hypothetical protein PENANT_c002G03541 [Penicillium antarcticum]|uniref:Gfd2/YDR514C-like C-terminal domain-containing protein n=1 Tax=Penicillium antarcticum TaxID=416450 RepID=A0A1V6QJM7_9EURO|nr:uncharacterized protein N7508_008646 [Penicillium antarcticum]KAJ5293825.1 hypothetical protein N7508_008646 [Penicillium antarcticum]OQD89413.1 hypothetical protein PENANT_c002G03541 [Penicillium antarcticum]